MPSELTPTFDGKQISIGGVTWNVAFPIAHVRRVGSRVFVIYDYMSGPTDRAFHNLEAYDLNGRKLCTAQNPGTDDNAADAYIGFISDDPLIASNFTCFDCTIDQESGRIIRTKFTK